MKNGLVIVNRSDEGTNVTYFDREQIEFAKQNAIVDRRIKQEFFHDQKNGDDLVVEECTKIEKGKGNYKRKFSLLVRVCEMFGTLTVLSLGWIKTELALAIVAFCLISICVQAGMLVEGSNDVE